MESEPRVRLAGFVRALGSEVARWPSSAGLFVPLLGVAVATMQALLYLVAGTNHSWNGVLAWNVTWVTGLATPAVGLLVGMVAVRDRAGRDGGMSWRPVSPLIAAWARWCVLAAGVVAMDMLAIVPVLLIGSSLGVPPTGQVLVGRVLLTAVVVALGGVALIPVWDLIARRFGLFTTVGASLVWGIAGVLTAENPWWWVYPFAWPIRATLPLLGTHANGTFLTARDPIALASPVPAIQLTVLLLLVVMAVASFILIAVLPNAGVTRATRRPRNESVAGLVRPMSAPRRDTVVQCHRGSALLAVLVSLRRTNVLTAVVGVVVIEGLAVLVWRRGVYSSALFEYVTLPLVASLLPILVWSKMAPAWRVLAIRPGRPGRLTVSLRGAIVLYVVGFALVGSGIEAAAGVPYAHVIRAVIITVTLGMALASLQLWLAVRFSVVLSLAVLGVGMLLSLTTGGTSLASRLWMWGPWTWAGTVTTSTDPARMILIWFISLAAIISLQQPTTRALKRYAAASH
jgi:hypothetical protein